MYKFFIILFLLSNFKAIAQSDVDRILKGGEIIVNGLALLKKDKTQEKAQEKKEETKVIESVCIQNLMGEKITFSLNGKDAKGAEFTKELVIQNDSKECVFDLPKGVYEYKIVLSNKEIYKKGEYKFDDELTLIVKQETGNSR